MANPWFRLYSRIMTDPKLEALSFEDQRHFVWVLCMKNEGYLDELFPSPDARERMISRKLGLQSEAFESARKRLLEVGLIDKLWNPVKWDDLQYISDSSNERVRKYREKKKKEPVGEVVKRYSNVTSTVTVTPQEQIQNRTDTEQSRAENKTRTKARVISKPSTVDTQVWDDFKTHRSKLRAAITETVILGIEREAILANVSLNDALRTCCERGWRSFKAEWVSEKLVDPKGRVSTVTMKSMHNLQEYLRD